MFTPDGRCAGFLVGCLNLRQSGVWRGDVLWILIRWRPSSAERDRTCRRWCLTGLYYLLDSVVAAPHFWLGARSARQSPAARSLLLASICSAASRWRPISGPPPKLLRPAFSHLRFRAVFRDILRWARSGWPSRLAAHQCTIAMPLRQVGAFGTAAIAGSGTAARLDVPAHSHFPLVSYSAVRWSPSSAPRSVMLAASGRGRDPWIARRSYRHDGSDRGGRGPVAPCVLSLFASDQAMLCGVPLSACVGPPNRILCEDWCLFFASQGSGRLTWPVARQSGAILP